jgi:hypothetical protein
VPSQKIFLVPRIHGKNQKKRTTEKELFNAEVESKTNLPENCLLEYLFSLGMSFAP